jgi:hypothetical protein
MLLGEAVYNISEEREMNYHDTCEATVCALISLYLTPAKVIKKDRDHSLSFLFGLLVVWVKAFAIGRIARFRLWVQ